MRKLRRGEKKESLFIGSIDGYSLEEIQNLFDRLANDRNVFSDTIEFEREGWGDDACYNLVGIREETLPEKARRETAERRRRVKAGERKKAKEEAERKEYERLKKKFGDN